MRINDLGFAAQCFVVVAALMLAGCQSAPKTTATGQGAQVVSVKGAVRCSDVSHPWRKLRAGDALATGNLIQTALSSELDFAVGTASGGDADRILLQADSVVVIESLPVELATGTSGGAPVLKLYLREGAMIFTGSPSGAGSACEIRFAKGVATASGATFELRADGSLKVFGGAVALQAAGDNPARSIPAGNQYDPRTGGLSPLSVDRAVAAPAPTPAAAPAPATKPATKPAPRPTVTPSPGWQRKY